MTQLKMFIKDYAIIIDVSKLCIILENGVLKKLDIKNAKILQKDIFSKAIIEIFRDEFGFILNHDYISLDNVYLSVIRDIKDYVYSYIIKSGISKLNLNNYYYVSTYIENYNLHILISTWSKNE